MVGIVGSSKSSRGSMKRSGNNIRSRSSCSGSGYSSSSGCGSSSSGGGCSSLVEVVVVEVVVEKVNYL